MEFGDETSDRAVVDGLRGDPPKTRPSGEARKPMADPLVGRLRIRVQAWLGRRPRVISIGRSPEAAMARARSLRRFAQRLGDTLALAAPVPSRVARRSASPAGLPPGAGP